MADFDSIPNHDSASARSRSPSGTEATQVSEVSSVTEAAAALLGSIATDAHALGRLCAMVNGANDAEGQILMAAQALAQRIGFLADQAGERMGRGLVIGDAIDWMADHQRDHLQALRSATGA